MSSLLRPSFRASRCGGCEALIRRSHDDGLERSANSEAGVVFLETDPEKHTLAKARVGTRFSKRLVPAQAGITLHQFGAYPDRFSAAARGAADETV